MTDALREATAYEYTLGAGFCDCWIAWLECGHKRPMGRDKPRPGKIWCDECAKLKDEGNK